VNRSAFLPILFALIAGGLVGFVIGRGAAPKPPSTDLPGRERAEELAEEARSPEPAPIPAATAETLGEILAALPKPRIPTGSGSITGRILTTEGAPVSGVLVRATWTSSGRGGRRAGGPPRDRSLEERVRLLHRSHHLDRATRREARTAADGTYRIEGLVDGAYNVRAYSAGYQIWTRGRAFGVSPGAEVDFQARAIAGVTLEVLDPDGNLAREATITFTQETGFGGTTSSSERWSSANRTVYAQPGTWSVQAKSGDHGEMVSEPETVTLEAGGEPPTATLRLRGRPGIRGSIRFEDGIDDGQYFVTTVRVPRGVEAGPGLLLTAARSAGHSIWPEGGRFAITDLEPGLYVLGATRGGGEVATWCEVEVTEGLVERDLVIPPRIRPSTSSSTFSDPTARR
jgi:hypothetical protein